MDLPAITLSSNLKSFPRQLPHHGDLMLISQTLSQYTLLASREVVFINLLKLEAERSQ